MADQPEIWPDSLRKLVDGCLNQPWTAERLGGMSGSRVYRIQGHDASAILKVSSSPAEHRFYATVAPKLRSAGIGIPHLFDAATVNDLFCLVLEDIRDPLPYARGADWRPDERVIDMLARLHFTTQAWSVPEGTLVTWSWTPDMTRAALDELAVRTNGYLADQLKALEAAGHALFQPACWISGDPNPLNWGVRPDGSLALFDWELFGPGSPAIDLAVSVPGLGDRRTYKLTAATYLEARSALPGARVSVASVDDLARTLAPAKAASVVQLLHGHATGTAHVTPAILAWLRESFPAWIDEMSSTL